LLVGDLLALLAELWKWTGKAKASRQRRIFGGWTELILVHWSPLQRKWFIEKREKQHGKGRDCSLPTLQIFLVRRETKVKLQKGQRRRVNQTEGGKEREAKVDVSAEAIVEVKMILLMRLSLQRIPWDPLAKREELGCQNEASLPIRISARGF